MDKCEDGIILETRDVYREVLKNGRQFRTVDEISYQFNQGKIYNIVGPSGSGKSSYLRLMNRLDEPTGGEVRFRSKAVGEYKTTYLRKRVSLLFQTPYLFPGTVESNLLFCCSDKKIEDMGFHLKRVGLTEDFAEANAEELSVGEKQRVALARALVQEPEVLLLDEPTSALDPTAAEKIEQLILELARELCLTVITVTHNPEQALRLGGRTLLLVKGKLIESGETVDVLKNPKSDPGKKYINKELI